MNFVVSALSHIPIIGWFIKDAREGTDTCKILFFFNLVALWILSINIFGYPALITGALLMVPGMFLTLITITAGDAFLRQAEPSEFEG